MNRLTRRSLIRSGAASLTPAQLAISLSTPAAGIQLAHFMSAGQPDSWRVWKQIGVDHAITGVAGLLGRIERSRYAEALAKVRADFNAAGIEVAGVESHPVSAEKIKLGLPGRDEEIEI